MKEKNKKNIYLLLLFFTLFAYIKSDETDENLRILGIEPNSGPTSGETRVMIRLKNLDEKTIIEYPHPKCRFGSKESEVEAVYVKCTSSPKKINELETDMDLRNDVR